MTVAIRQEAIADIDSIWLYTKEQWSLDQANRYTRTIYKEIERLAAFPMAGKDCSDLGKGYRYSQVKSHFIFYVVRKDNTIEVLRILHEGMNFMAWLTKEL